MLPSFVPAPPVRLRSLGWSIYLPSTLYAVGQGALAPVIVTSAVERGASLGVAGALVASVWLGQIAGDLPSGWLVGRIGERRAMLLAGAVLVPALVACLAAPALWLFALGVFLTGVCGATWSLARQQYVTDAVPYVLRARALATLAGTHRVGFFLGPFAGAAATAGLGSRAAILVSLAATLLAVVALGLGPDVLGSEPSTADSIGGAGLDVVRQNVAVLRTLGVAVACTGALRACRQVVVPLWGTHIGLSASTISVIFGLSVAIDVLLFYPGGKIMDSYGRRWVAVPSTLMLGVAHALLPLAHEARGLILIALLMGLANGTTGGIMMTLGADVAPRLGRSQFIGAWRLLHDVGQGTGPFALSGLIVALSPTAALVSVGALGLMTAWGMNRWIPRYAGKRHSPSQP